MKLAFVEVAGFRGFRAKTRFEIPPGFAVLTGRNGAGKSTVFDAIDFALTGTINKFDVTVAKGGGLDSHIWWLNDEAPDGYFVTIGVRSEDGEVETFTRTRDRGLTVGLDEVRRQLCLQDSHDDRWAETFMRTTLIRDETLAGLSLDLPQQARFEAVRAAIGALTGADHSARADALARAAATAKAEQEARAAEAQAELGRALGALTEARSNAERQADVARAEAIIRAMAPDLVGSGQSDELRRRVATLKREADESRRVLARASTFWVTHNAGIELVRAEAAILEQLVKANRGEVVQAEAAVASAAELMVAERELDQQSTQWAALLEHGLAVGLQGHHCPLCDAARSDQEFADAIEATRRRLGERGARLQEVAARLNDAETAARKARGEVQDAEQKLVNLRRQISQHDEEHTALKAEFARLAIKADPADQDEADLIVLGRQEDALRLEEALYILESSTAHDRVAALESQVERLRSVVDEETAKATAAEKAVEATKQIKNAAITVGNQMLTEQFDTVMPLLKELYRRLRPHTDWREIETDFGGRVRASLNFTVGDGRNPQFLFSSGQRRAAGLAFLLAIHLSRPWCKLRSLWLDDPVQHVDDYRALNLVEVLAAIRRSGRQVMVAVEDSALADLLCRRLRSTSDEPGRRFELGTGLDGSAIIAEHTDIEPMPRAVLQLAEAS